MTETDRFLAVGRSFGSAPGGVPGWKRRHFLKVLSAAGVSSAVFGRALVALAAEKSKVTPQMIRQAEWIAGLELSDEKRKLMREWIRKSMRSLPHAISSTT